MKILLISSSPHKENGKTFILAKGVLGTLLRQGYDCEAIHLDDLNISFCKHCEACHINLLHCSAPDDVGVVLKKMLEADGIILASPNYINQVTASMKALFDRSSHFIHCKRLLGKYVAGVVSSGSGKDKEVLDYMKFYAHACGAQFSGGVSSAADSVYGKIEEAAALGAKLAADIKEKRAYPDQLELIESAKAYFGKIIKARKNDWRQEYQYWLDKGWL